MQEEIKGWCEIDLGRNLIRKAFGISSRIADHEATTNDELNKRGQDTFKTSRRLRQSAQTKHLQR